MTMMFLFDPEVFLVMDYKLMSPNEAFSRVWYFPSDRLPEVHIFNLEHITGDMNYFLNRYNRKSKQKQQKTSNSTPLKHDVINVSNRTS